MEAIKAIQFVYLISPKAEERCTAMTSKDLAELFTGHHPAKARIRMRVPGPSYLYLAPLMTSRALGAGGRAHAPG